MNVRGLTTKLRLHGRPVTVVDRLSFDLKKGKTLALVGESGSGKSLTALSLLRILPDTLALPPEGEVWYGARDLLKVSEHEMRKIRGVKIAMIFQNPMSALNPVYTIASQLREVLELHTKLSAAQIDSRMRDLLQEVGITPPERVLQSYPHQLSGGMQQRVMIAMALLCEPDILIADEPTTALDVTIQAQVLKLLRDLQEKMGLSILLITHDMSVVAAMADEVVVLYATQGVECADVATLFNAMSHPYTQGLFNSRPGPHLAKGKLEPIRGAVPSVAELPSGCRFHPRCPYAMEICRQGEVPKFQLAASNHWAACWLHRDKPKIV